MNSKFCSPSSSGKHPPAGGRQSDTGILGSPYPSPTPVPTTHLTTHTQGLQAGELSLGTEEHIVGHAEALPHAEVVEQGGLCQGAAHLQHDDICGHRGVGLRADTQLQGQGDAHPQHSHICGHRGVGLRAEAQLQGEEPGEVCHFNCPACTSCQAQLCSRELPNAFTILVLLVLQKIVQGPSSL